MSKRSPGHRRRSRGASQLGRLPPHRRLPYTGTQRTVDEMLQMAKGPRGSQSLRVRKHVERILRHVAPRDTLSQLAALYYHYWSARRHNYFRDPVDSELVKDPEAIVEEMETEGVFLGDCDDAATYLTGVARSAGIRARPVRVSFVPGRKVTVGVRPNGQAVRKTIKAPFSHVLVVARDQYGRVVALDPVAGERTTKMLRQTRRFK